MPAERKKITLITGHLSGSNTALLYKRMPQYILDKYDVSLEASLSFDKLSQRVNNSDVLVTTHGNHPAFKDKVLIELWHGFPLKCMANRDIHEQADSAAIAAYWDHVDLIMSYSDTYTTLLNACMGSNVRKYRVTGMPRNDALFDPNSRNNLEKVLGRSLKGRKILFYMPTFRKSASRANEFDGSKHWRNLFGFDSFDHEQFQAYLEANNITLIVKLHPFEESLVKEHVNTAASSNIVLLENLTLTTKGIDLYEAIGCSDMLITDYSSIYFDYLLADKPILFTPIDLEEYKTNRGFLLNPYEEWTPGAKAFNQDELQSEITRGLEDPNHYGTERKRIRDIVHAYQDDRSTDRVWEQIDTYLDQTFQRNQEIDTLNQKLHAYLTGLIESGQTDEAQKMMNKYSESVSTLPSDLLLIRAVLHFIYGRYANAVEDLLLAKQSDPANPDIYFNLGKIYDQLGDRYFALHYYALAKQYASDSETKETVEALLSALNQ